MLLDFLVTPDAVWPIPEPGRVLQTIVAALALTGLVKRRRRITQRFGRT
jgi:hypothetical protein